MTKDYFPTTFNALTVGFDQALKQIETATRNYKPLGYPPYNVVKVDDNKYVIEIAVAGFSKQDLEVELKENSLIITGKISSNNENTNYLYKGIADRTFMRKFNLADTIEIQNTQLVNGMLKVFLENIIPESKKPKKLEINEG
jgi:molecular chaperone IbpA